MKKMQKLGIKYFITILSFISLNSKINAQNKIEKEFYQTCNVYRTFASGEVRGDFKEMKWQVRFKTSGNSIQQYFEKDGFPATSFKLNETFEVVECKKVEDYKYVYFINNTTAIFFNSKSPTTITITKDGGKTFIEYATYDSYYKKFQ